VSTRYDFFFKLLFLICRYCSNDNCGVLQEKVKAFVKQIYRFQTKAHFRDAEKAKIHRRYVLGLRETDKYLKLRKLKLIVIATDLEANSEEGKTGPTTQIRDGQIIRKYRADIF